jgi:hypothetical protein
MGENEDDYVGDPLHKKHANILRIGFQNVGGVSSARNKLKDDILRCGIDKYDFDIFGIAEVNVNWSHVTEEDRLINRSKYWWDTNHWVSQQALIITKYYSVWRGSYVEHQQGCT